ncbi:hypothetical protein BC832DRAFT_51946 [Gaertneriomyces semiglobifer]|nr:hypothetical protein BC832DRAFT_51946 [Gaertneriomyces semiglobifer]
MCIVTMSSSIPPPTSSSTSQLPTTSPHMSHFSQSLSTSTTAAGPPTLPDDKTETTRTKIKAQLNNTTTNSSSMDPSANGTASSTTPDASINSPRNRIPRSPASRPPLEDKCSNEIAILQAYGVIPVDSTNDIKWGECVNISQWMSGTNGAAKASGATTTATSKPSTTRRRSYSSPVAPVGLASDGISSASCPKKSAASTVNLKTGHSNLTHAKLLAGIMSKPLIPRQPKRRISRKRSHSFTTACAVVMEEDEPVEC